MENRYKRQERKMSDEQRAKISQTMKNKNIRHTDEWNRKISDGQKKAWSKIPYKKTQDLSMDDYLNGVGGNV
jgi:hypothetical protein